MMKDKLFFFIFVVFVLLSLTVRLVGLEKSPISLNFDEAGLGYNAYSLLKTGRDEYGYKWPISLRSFNDYKPALYSYLTIPAIWLLGLNQTSTRAISAIFGSISLIFWFLIFKKITGTSDWKALIITVFVSFLPWRLHYSRVAFESNLSMAFFSISIWGLMNFNSQKSKVITILSSLAAIYSYHGARLAIPLVLGMYLFDPFNSKSWKLLLSKPGKVIKKFWPIMLVVVFSIPIFLGNDTPSVMRRFQQTNVFGRYYPFTPEGLRYKNNVWTQIIANPSYFLVEILTGHVQSYFSPKNLGLNVFKWVNQSPQVISGSGMLGWLGAIFFIFGIKYWLKELNNKILYRQIGYWILAGIAPATLTMEWFHPLRSLNSYPAIELIVGLGLLFLINSLRGKLVLYVLLALLFTSSIYNVENEFNYSIWDSNGEFQPGGYKEGARLLDLAKENYKTVYLDSPHAQSYIMFLFYLKYPPEVVQRYAETRPPMGAEGFLNFDFGNFVYRKYNWPDMKKMKNIAIWTSAEVLENEITEVPGAKLYKIQSPVNSWVASLITIE